jgi:hypothetical protein
VRDPAACFNSLRIVFNPAPVYPYATVGKIDSNRGADWTGERGAARAIDREVERERLVAVRATACPRTRAHCRLAWWVKSPPPFTLVGHPRALWCRRPLAHAACRGWWASYRKLLQQQRLRSVQPRPRARVRSLVAAKLERDGASAARRRRLGEPGRGGQASSVPHHGNGGRPWSLGLSVASVATSQRYGRHSVSSLHGFSELKFRGWDGHWTLFLDRDGHLNLTRPVVRWIKL